ncbi:MAG TPA: Ig-like domain-containing protein, partial [Opitutaceae bacterium]
THNFGTVNPPKIDFYVNGSSLSTDATTPYTAAWNPGAAGTYRLTAMATDNAGNQTLSAVVVVTLTGNNAPTVSITTPSSGLLTNSGSPVALTAQAADADGTVASVRFLANGVVVGTPATAAPFAVTWTPTAPGVYTLIAQATDDSGNVTSSAPISVTVSVNAAPVVAVTAPANSAVIRTGSVVTLTAAASDPDGTIASVRFLANGTAVGVADTTAPYSVAWTPNAEGVFRLTAIALDSSGISTTSAAATVLIVAAGAGDTVYAGTFAGLGETGRFAAINLGGASASFIGFSTPAPGSSTAPTIYYYPSLAVDAIGGFSRTDGSGRTVISGTASEAGISGTIDNGRLIFIGPISLGAASSVSPGYYTGSLGGRLGSTLSVIVGADGAMMAYVADGAYRDAGAGTLARTGAFVITLVSGNRITGTIDPATGFVSGTIGGTVVAGVTAALSSGVSFSDGFLRNLSTRGQVGTGANLLIAGFVVGGTTPKQVLVRAIGPSLSAFGVGGVLADPQLEIYSGSNLVATNNNWGGGLPIIDASNRVGAFPVPGSSLDAVLMLTLSPGSYTAQVRGVANGTGVALVELYDVDSLTPFSPQKVMNVASRGVVGTGQAQLIAGFVVSGNTPKKILVRGVGPTLEAFGVAGALADPVLSITRSDGLAVRENDNWETGNDAMLVAAAAERVRAFALGAGSRDAALLLQLPPGSYTAQVTGAGSTTGVALVEVYEVP